MATNITQYNATAGSNTSIDSINLQEGQMVASDVNNAIRSLMSHLKNVDTGSQALTALSVTGNVTVAGNIQKTSGDLTVDVAGDIILDADGADIKLADNGTVYGELTNSSSYLRIKNPIQDQDIEFVGNDGGSDVTALRLDMSEAGDATFNNRAVFNSNVSIGTTSFPSKFTVSHAGTDNIIETANTTNSVRGGMQADTSIVAMGAITNHTLVFRQNNTERMRIDTGARLAFGNTDTNAKITVSQNGNALNLMRLQNTDGTHNARFIQFANSGNNDCGHIDQSGSNTIAYNTSSDYRLKENISYNFDATTRLKQLKPARFNFVDDGTDKTMDGFIAHEVSSIVPEAVSGTKDATRDIGTIKNKDGDVTAENAPQTQSNTDENETWEKTGTENIYQGIDLGKLVPLLTKALQEQQATIEALTARIVTLENA